MIKKLTALLLAAVLALGPVAPAWAQQPTTASLLPNGVQQFFTANGKPVSNGTVTHYVPGTTTGKTVWQDSTETTPWPLHIPLNAGGFPSSGSNIHGIYGDGTYRQIVTDQYNNVIWDVPTSSNGSGGGGGGPSIGDGQLPGAMQPWSGFIAPPNWAFAFGQALSRVTYSNLLANVTFSTTVVCGAGSPTITAISDTSQITVGAAFEAQCATPGLAVVSKTASTVTLNGNANVSGTVTGTFFPWGDGDQATTFNVPDMRGVVPAGRPNMGGTDRGNLLAANFGTATDGIGPTGGEQSITLAQANIPPYTPTGSIAITDPGHSHGYTGTSQVGSGGGGGVQALIRVGDTTSAAFTGITAAYNGTPQGSGHAASATVAAVGSGYTNGSQTVTVVGGTCSTPPTFGVTVAGGVFTGTPTLTTAGQCSVFPTSPAATSGAGGTGGKLNITWTLDPQQSFPIIQPTTIVNWIIKVLPDTSVSIATGVSSLGGMTGVLACGTGLNCSSNTVSVVSNVAAGADTQVQINSLGQLAGYPALTWLSPTLTIGLTGTATGQVVLAGSTSGAVTQTVQAAAGTPTVTWGTTSGTPAVAAASPLVLTNTTGALTCPTCATTSGGGTLSATAPLTLTGNVLALTTPLSLTFGGTNAALTASNGGILWSNATQLQILSGTATAGQMLRSGTSGAPTWSTATWPATTTLNGLLYSSAANVVASLASANNGVLVTGGTGVPAISSTLPSGIAATNMALTTPSLGVATATTINGLTINATTGGILGIGNGKTLNLANSLTLAGTDGTTMTFPASSATVAALNLTGQTLSGGANVTSLSQTAGNLTVNCGLGPLQFQTNNGAFTLTAPVADGSCMLLSTNGASAGTITFSGFSQGSNSGDPLTTTNGNKFTIQVWRINGTSGYRVAAHQ